MGERSATTARHDGLAHTNDVVARVERELGATVGEYPTPSTDLAIPEPRTPIPPGWLEGVFVPAVEGTTDWQVLEDAEARVQALIGYLGREREDKAVLRAALRAIEIRRGVLLGPAHPGRRTDLEPRPTVGKVPCDASRQVQDRWRRLAEHRDVIWPQVIEAARAGDAARTTQVHCLAIAEGRELDDSAVVHEPEAVRRCRGCRKPWPCPNANEAPEGAPSLKDSRTQNGRSSRS